VDRVSSNIALRKVDRFAVRETALNFKFSYVVTALATYEALEYFQIWDSHLFLDIILNVEPGPRLRLSSDLEGIFHSTKLPVTIDLVSREGARVIDAVLIFVLLDELDSAIRLCRA
jgi:hypothetical protein